MNSEVVVNTALLVQIEMLESDNQLLKKKVSDLESRRKAFRIDDISEDDNLSRLYTGFVSFRVLKATQTKFIVSQACPHGLITSRLGQLYFLIWTRGDHVISRGDQMTDHMC